MDKNITSYELNTLEEILTYAPNLKLIAFNGKSAKQYKQFIQSNAWGDVKHLFLPSSSSANAKPKVVKEKQWKEALAGYLT